MKKLLAAIVVAALIGAAVAGALVYELVRYAHTPVETIREPVVVEIERGRSFNAVIRDLEDKDIVDDRLRWTLIARYTGHDETMRYGEYRIRPGMTPMDIMNRFSRGKVVLHRVTLPEGFTMENIAARLEAAGLCDRDTFMRLATDEPFVESLGIPAATVEGYLFPDTYFFEKNPSEKAVIRAMVERFHETFRGEWEARAAQLGFSIHDVVTLAAIIEKETALDRERAIVSSVFHNRLARNMRLESDPTVVYGLEDFDGRIRTRHLRENTPYNTYVHRGLPPGPIASPGFASLHAALYPAETDYLFFVAKSGREHHFSETYEEHRRAVEKYILGR